MNAIAVLTRIPHSQTVEFYAGFTRLGYDVFVIVDDNNFKANHAGVYFVQIDDAECRKAGFFNFNPMIKKKDDCSAWDKALYYFCRINTSHENVWFIEDDVFIPLHETIRKIDRRYGIADIISQNNEVNEHGILNDWYWWKCIPRKQLPPPWAHSMVCAVRLSRKLMKELDYFISRNNNEFRLAKFAKAFFKFLKRKKDGLQINIFFIEYIFHTLALHNKLTVVVANELRGIQWRKEWDVSEMDVETLYHPVKDNKLHDFYRKILVDNKAASSNLKS